jgi:hypothetical protein
VCQVKIVIVILIAYLHCKTLLMQDAYQDSVNFSVSDYSPAGGGGGEFFFLSPQKLVRYQPVKALVRYYFPCSAVAE